MCGSMADIQSPTTEIRRRKKRKSKKEQMTGWKYIWSALLHRAAINNMSSVLVFAAAAVNWRCRQWRALMWWVSCCWCWQGRHGDWPQWGSDVSAQHRWLRDEFQQSTHQHVSAVTWHGTISTRTNKHFNNKTFQLTLCPPVLGSKNLF